MTTGPEEGARTQAMSSAECYPLWAVTSRAHSPLWAARPVRAYVWTCLVAHPERSGATWMRHRDRDDGRPAESKEPAAAGPFFPTLDIASSSSEDRKFLS